jgi:23S rRNA pseudouridine2605 synthase
MVRLQKYLADCGIASRRAAEGLIAQGRVAVNGSIAQIGQQVTPGEDEVTLDGQPAGAEKKVYILLNKPEGAVTTAADTHGRKTVLDCIHGVRARLFPVGRLDMDVEGALLLTNDGDLAYRLMHPRFEVPKVYMARVRGRVQPEAIRHIESGVELEDGMTAPARCAIANRGDNTTLIRLTLHEGKKREVKRMCAAVGHPVITLHRVSFGNVRVEGLRSGEWRYLTNDEVLGLRKLAGDSVIDA